MNRFIKGKEIELGTCYYPEHWSKELWREDLSRMQSVGITAIRIAEFAWSKVEPTEGCFTFDFFDSFLNLAEETGMRVIFCTPTATPPAWLTEKYPEVLNADLNGVLYRHGERRHYNYNSPKYLELSARIVEKVASHYAKHPCVIGWQIDNEINCECDVFYSDSDTLAFRRFLKEKYQTLDQLNEAWGTVFWNQTYTSFEEIYVPRPAYMQSVNPHLELDYKRFISQSARNYVKMQSDIIRKYIKQGDFITTNGLFGNLDSHKMNKESLDFFMYDSYPNFAYCLSSYNNEDAMLDRHWSENLSIIRSISKHFGIMEQQSGANGWNTRMEAPTPRPLQMTLWTMQSIAHGADYISYFRWRTCTFGTEMYWHGILDYSGRDNRRLKEVASIHSLLDSIKDITDTSYHAEVAIIQDYDNIWDSELDNWHKRVSEVSYPAVFTACQVTHTPVDYLYLSDATKVEELCAYAVIFYPHATLINQKRADLLTSYVEKGGKLIVGCRSGYKDMTGKCVMQKLPGLLSDLTGTDIPEYSLIAPDSDTVTMKWDREELRAEVFTDLLEPKASTSEVCARYTSDYFAGTPALICNKLGKGEAYYFGSAFRMDAAKVFLQKLGAADPYGNILAAPECCEVAVRETKDHSLRYLFVLNYSKEKVTVMWKQPVKPVITKAWNWKTNQMEDFVKETPDGHLLGACELGGYGVMVVGV